MHGSARLYIDTHIFFIKLAHRELSNTLKCVQHCLQTLTHLPLFVYNCNAELGENGFE